MFGNMEEMQQEMQGKLAAIIVDAEAGDGAIKITATATREITNIAIDKEKIDLNDTEELEDLLLVAMNRVLNKATEEEARVTQEQIKNMMPPGMEGLSNLFG